MCLLCIFMFLKCHAMFYKYVQALKYGLFLCFILLNINTFNVNSEISSRNSYLIVTRGHVEWVCMTIIMG